MRCCLFIHSKQKSVRAFNYFVEILSFNSAQVYLIPTRSSPFQCRRVTGVESVKLASLEQAPLLSGKGSHPNLPLWHLRSVQNQPSLTHTAMLSKAEDKAREVQGKFKEFSKCRIPSFFRKPCGILLEFVSSVPR